ncbi:hypothetical protein, partial [Caballeronia novacaledonica]|uniref:hypothetical protein n=1 Tax=Caballeronia novacaledonica TaxID=1544861 RepID=UPI001C20C666
RAHRKTLKPSLPSCVAASAAEKRDYEQRFGSCQQDFKLSFLADRARNPSTTHSEHTADTATPASFAFIESRRNGILVSAFLLRKRHTKK